MINYRVILNLLGALMIFNGLLMLSSIIVCLFYGESISPILYSSCITIVLGFIFYLSTFRNIKMDLRMKEGYLVVTLSWLIVSLTGAIPYVISGAIPSYTDAFFETISGYTTTGATILSDIESLPKSILFWRSMTHWLGGMGIIVLAIAIMPILGFGGMQMFAAEASGLTTDKLHPRITDTAKRLWVIYVFYTIVQTVLLMFGEMDFFDSLNHAFSSISTGGFSTKNDSLISASAYTQYVVIIFMFLGGINFSLHYFLLKGKFSKIWKNEEFRFYTFLLLFLGILVAIALYWKKGLPAEESFREGLFQMVSIITTTGFVSVDYGQWSPFLVYLIFIITFFGGCAGSTSGGLKMVRVRLLLKDSALELKRILHPRAVIPVRISGKPVTREIMANVLAFFFFYILMFASGAMILSMIGVDFVTSLSASAACITNVGPGIGEVGAVDNYSKIPVLGKWLLSFMMLVGRLEIFTVLLLFSPAFWKKV